MINIVQHHGQNVVDSRVIAQDLGIAHKNFLETVRKYSTQLEQFGVFAFETAKPLGASTGGRPETFCYLNEDQATFIMTLSRNTDRVVQCKMNLVQAFKNARQTIAVQGDEIKHLELQLEVLKAQQKLLDTRHIIVSTCPEPVQQKILGYQLVEKVEYRDRVIHDDEIIRDGTTLNKTQLCHRYGYLTRNGKPDYAKLKKALAKVKLPSEAWKLTASIMENQELESDYIDMLDQQMIRIDRQLNLGE